MVGPDMQQVHHGHFVQHDTHRADHPNHEVSANAKTLIEPILAGHQCHGERPEGRTISKWNRDRLAHAH